MKLLTTITPRSNDTVTYTEFVNGKPAQTIIFARDAESGELVAEVTDEATIGRLLLTGTFQPLNEEDYGIAEAILEAAKPKKKRRFVEVDEDDDEDDDEQSGAANGGLPVEANTPPAAPRKSPQARMGRGSRSNRVALGA